MLQGHLENALSDSDEMYKTKNQLENAIETLHSKLANSEQKCVEFEATNGPLEKENTRLNQEALDHANNNDFLNQVVDRLRKELHESSFKAKTEMYQIFIFNITFVGRYKIKQKNTGSFAIN